MAQYSNLKAYIEEKIYENGTQAITGDILQDVLKVMTDDLGEFYQTGGVASPSTDPGIPDAKVIYFATEAGTYTNFRGITLAAGEVALLVFDTSWEKVTLNILSSANGAVKSNNLADGAVTTEKIAGGAVETAKIADNAVTTGKVANGAIGTAKIADGAIDADKIAANAVESAKIKNGAVTQGKINDGAVTAGKIASNAVTTDKIKDDAVTSDKIANNAVGNDQLASGAVHAGNIADGAVTAPKIGGGAVTSGKIGSGAVTEEKIADGAVTTSKIANGAVGSDQLAEGAFSAENLADGSVTTDKLADEAVTAEKIADGAVTAGKFANGSVTTIKLGSGAVTTEKIGDGMVTRQKLADSSVGTSKIIDGAVTGAKLQEGVRPVINVNALNEQTSAYGSAALARAAVPSALRILGLHVIYLLAGGWFEDEFIGSDVSGWGTASNWRAVGPVSISQNTETGHDKITIGGVDYETASVEDVNQLGQQVIYDVSAHNSGATFASLSALLSDADLATLIPTGVRCGGMSIRFIQTSDNNYVQYFYKPTSTAVVDFRNTDNWEKTNLWNEVDKLCNAAITVDTAYTSGKYIDSGGFIANTSLEGYAISEFISIVGCSKIRTNVNLSGGIYIGFYKINSASASTIVGVARQIVNGYFDVEVPQDAKYMVVSNSFTKQSIPVIQLIPDSLSVSSMLLTEEYSENGSVTYDGNGNILSYPIKWKDGTSGTYTNTSWDADNYMYRGYEITYGSSYKLIQPAVTVVSGVITNIPLKNIVKQ